MARTDHIQVLNDNAEEVCEAMKRLPGYRILVGIPSTAAGRKEPGAPSNAVIGYVHEFGEPRRNIPARAFLVPGIVNVTDKIAYGLRRAGELALNNDCAGIIKQLHATGMVAVSSVKRKLTTGPFVPLAPATVAARLRKTKRGRLILGNLRSKGTDLGKWGADNLKPLLDTRQMSNAVTYIVQLKGKAV